MSAEIYWWPRQEGAMDLPDQIPAVLPPRRRDELGQIEIEWCFRRARAINFAHMPSFSGRGDDELAYAKSRNGPALAMTPTRINSSRIGGRVGRPLPMIYWRCKPGKKVTCLRRWQLPPFPCWKD